MKVPLYVGNQMYLYDTIIAWKVIWEKICRMSYEKKDICSQIITHPYRARINGIENNNMNEKEHSNYYSKKIPLNDTVITLDDMWKYYSNQYKNLQELYVIPEFTRLHVPRALFQSLGITQWFRHSFPNCQVTFWEE